MIFSESSDEPVYIIEFEGSETYHLFKLSVLINGFMNSLSSFVSVIHLSFINNRVEEFSFLISTPFLRINIPLPKNFSVINFLTKCFLVTLSAPVTTPCENSK